MKTQEPFSRSWPECQGLTTIMITLALAGSSAWAGKPSKPPPEPQSGYRLVALGSGRAEKINEAGWVVGYHNYPLDGYDHAYLIIPEDTSGDGIPDVWARDDNEDGLNDLLIDLGTLGMGSTACGINDHGQIVGISSVSEEDWVGHALLWQVDAETHGIQMYDLGKLFADDYAVAWSINNLGQVVGYSLYAGRGFLINPKMTDGAQVWYEDGGNGVNSLMIDLGSVAGGFPIDINDSGEIVGTTGAVDRDAFGFLIRPEADGDGALCWFRDNGEGVNALMTLLPPLDGANTSLASAINGSGLIAGRSEGDPVLWQVDANDTIWTFDLGAIKGYEGTNPNDINEDGEVAGNASSWLGGVNALTGGRLKFTACFSENGVMVKLADRVVDWGPCEAAQSRFFGINNRGEMVGENWAVPGSFIAIPVP